MARPVPTTPAMARLILILGILGLSMAACGDTSLFFAFRSGTLIADATCHQDGGQFDLFEPTGLTVVVIFDSNTAIANADGSAHDCRDLRAGTAVQVWGDEDDMQVDADRIIAG